MTDLEKLIQSDEKPTVGGAIAILDKCILDWGRLMDNRQVVPTIHAKNLSYGLAHARAMLGRVYAELDDIFKRRTHNEAK